MAMTTDFTKCMKKMGKTDESPLSEREWQGMWKENCIPWQSESVNESVKIFFKKLRPTELFKRIYVPLCGKTQDMAWFHSKGLTVVGCDIAEEAGISFMEDHPELKITKKAVTLNSYRQIPLFESGDKNIRIYICSYTNMPNLDEDKFDMVWDRGAFAAINPSDREDYTRICFDILAPDFRWLQNTIEYPPGFRSLPPHSVSEIELRNLFTKYAYAEELSATAETFDKSFPWCTRRNMMYSPLNQAKFEEN